MNEVFIFDRDCWTVSYGDKTCRLPRNQMEVLLYLADHPGYVRSRKQIMDQRDPDRLDINDRSVDSTIRRCRASLRQAFGMDPIGTHSGVGYYWRKDMKMPGGVSAPTGPDQTT